MPLTDHGGTRYDPRNGHAPLTPYLRQSRAKERTISIKEQRRTIEAWATAAGVDLGSEVVEQDVSGSKNWRTRGLGKILEACEAGKAQGVIVAFQDRLSRGDLLGTAEVWTAFGEAGARIVACDDVDSAPEGQRLLYVVKAEIARHQWERFQANWKAARRHAIEQGKHVGPIPAGYSRGEDGRLYPTEHADAIRAAFQARAKGASWRQVAKLLEGVPTSRGATSWSLKATEKALRNEAYLGVVRSGDFRNEKAHEPLVDRGTWALVKAQKREGDYSNPSREPSMLSGIARCATCGHGLVRDHTTREA
jgi:DNA invertase Pin-like site-specific DNA recombinase